MLQRTPLSNGSAAPLAGPPVKFSRTPTRIRHGAPEPGEHSAEILAELGIPPGNVEGGEAARQPLA
jgi:formyl-CoA transferase